MQGMRIPRQAIKGYQGVGTITDSVYYLPNMDADGNIQVIRAYGVEEIAVVARTRLPPLAREIFPVIRVAMPWMETGAGHVELLIGRSRGRNRADGSSSGSPTAGVQGVEPGYRKPWER